MRMRRRFEDFKNWCPQPPERLPIKLNSYTVPIAVALTAALVFGMFFSLPSQQLAANQPLPKLSDITSSTYNSSQTSPLPTSTPTATSSSQSNNSSQVGYWTLNITTTNDDPNSVTPNGIVQVPMNQSGITVTDDGSVGFVFLAWVFDNQTYTCQSPTIFIPTQQVNSSHTLVALFMGSPVALPVMYFFTISPQNINVSQGNAQQITLTFKSVTSSELEVPIENLTVVGYTSDLNYNFNGNSSGWSTSAQDAVFTYSFSLSQLILQPYASNSTVLTINLADDAPSGSYSIEIMLGNEIFLTAYSPGSICYDSNNSMVMDVT